MAPPYRIIKAPGGTWHVHPGGRRTWHPARRPKPRPVPQAPRPPAAPAAPAAPTPFAPDSTYFADLARQRHQVQQTLQGYQREGAEDLTAYTESLRRYNEQEPLAQQNANESYNRQGLFYSGKLGQEKARLATQYARTRADMQSNYRSRETARAEARRALESGATIEEAAALAAAVDRGIERDTQAADANALVPNIPQAPTILPPAAQALPSRRRPVRGKVPRRRYTVRDTYRGGRYPRRQTNPRYRRSR